MGWWAIFDDNRVVLSTNQLQQFKGAWYGIARQLEPLVGCLLVGFITIYVRDARREGRA
jgi:hypothetical protein